MKRSQIRRDWTRARAKLEEEGVCRNCGTTEHLECAHIIGRDRDFYCPLEYGEDAGLRIVAAPTLEVHPDRIIPLCGPFPQGCHGAEHRHEIDTLPLLHLREQIQAVVDAGGIENARIRTCPSQYSRALGAA